MDCQRCGDTPATVQYTEVVAGQKSVRWLCAGCASDDGLLTTVTPTVSTPAVPQVDPEMAAQLRVRCPQCSTSLAAVRRTGRVGCPACYQTFETHLDLLLQRVHGALTHGPRRERILDPRADARRRLLRLQADLDRAVAMEDFEAAARLRDEIATAEAQLPGMEADR